MEFVVMLLLGPLKLEPPLVVLVVLVLTAGGRLVDVELFEL